MPEQVLPRGVATTRRTTTTSTTNGKHGTSRIILRAASEEARTATDEEKRLDAIAHQLKLEIYDLDEGVYGYATRDSHYGLEVLHSSILTTSEQGGALGIELTEMASSCDGRGLVLISGISGATMDSELQVGDALTRVRGGNFQECLTGLNYDLTVEAITEAKQAATGEQQGQP
jgi:hypothetical protein